MKKGRIAGIFVIAIAVCAAGIFYLQSKNNKADLPASNNAVESSGTLSTAPAVSESTVQTGNSQETTVNKPTKELTMTKEDGNVRITDGVYHSNVSLYDTGGKEGFDLISYNDSGRTLVYSYNVNEEKLVKLFDIENYSGVRILKDGSGVVYMGNSQTGEYGGRLVYLKSDGTVKQLLELCTWYEMSPDGQWIAANGTPDKASQNEQKIYLYSMKDESFTELEGIRTPSSWSQFLSFHIVWSSDSRHILLGNVIADADSKKVVKDLGADGYSLSNFRWSPDGSKLCYRAQSMKYEKYSLPGEDSSDRLSDKLGIYYTDDNSVNYRSFTDFLVYGLMWNSDSGSIAMTMIPIKSADELVKKGAEFNYKDSPCWVDIKTVNPKNLEVKDILSSYTAGSTPNLQGLRSFSGNELFFVRDKDGAVYLSAMNIDKSEFKDLMPEDSCVDSIIYKEGRTFILDMEWLYRLDEGYKPVKIWQRTVDGNISNDITLYPEINKIAFTRYDDARKNTYLEISNLNY